MYVVSFNKLNINWSDDNHCHIQDPDTGKEFNVTVRPKDKMWTSKGQPVKSRLYVGGPQVTARREFPLHQQTKWVREYFGPVVNKILNEEVDLKFRSKVGCACGCAYECCSCGCSPGFIIDSTTPFPVDIWMDAL